MDFVRNCSADSMYPCLWFYDHENERNVCHISTQLKELCFSEAKYFGMAVKTNVLV